MAYKRAHERGTEDHCLLMSDAFASMTTMRSNGKPNGKWKHVHWNWPMALKTINRNWYKYPVATVTYDFHKGKYDGEREKESACEDLPQMQESCLSQIEMSQIERESVCVPNAKNLQCEKSYSVEGVWITSNG